MTDNNGMDSDVRAEQADVQSEKKGGGGALIVVILIILIGLAIFFLTKKPAPSMGTVTEILPKECALFLQVDLDQAENKALRDELWAKMKESPEFKKKLDEFEAKAKVNVEQDLLSWIGNQMTVSFFEAPKPPASPGAPAPEPEKFVVVFSISDQAKAAEKLKELTTNEKYTEEKQGEIAIMVPPDKNSPVVAIVKGMLVLADTKDDMIKVIDVSMKKAPSLRENKDVDAMMRKIPPKSMAIFYMDMAPFMAAGVESMPQKDENVGKFLKAFKGMAIGVAEKQGNIVGSGALSIDKSSDSPIVKAMFETKPSLGDPSTLKLFPKDTTYYGATDIKWLYAILIKFAELQPNGAQQIESGKEEFKKNSGVDMDKDILDNLAGELAYTIDITDLMQSMSSQGGPMGRREPPPIVLAIKVKDKAKMKTILDTLTAKAGPMLQKSEMGGCTVFALPQNSGAFTVFEDFFVFGLGVGGKKIDTIIENKMDESKSLASSEGYKMIKSTLGANTISVGMVQFEKLTPFMELAMAAAPAQKPEGKEAVKQMMNYMKKYNEVWTTNDITSDGFSFNFVMLKAKEAPAEKK